MSVCLVLGYTGHPYLFETSPMSDDMKLPVLFRVLVLDPSMEGGPGATDESRPGLHRF